jgi:predicted DCC family thiol-disulfide oxidoreductase YuxK
MKRTRGIVCYDGECPLCLGLINRWGRALRRAGFRLARLQTDWVQRRLGLTGVPDEMKLIVSDGRVLGGADAVLAIAEGLGLAHAIVEGARSAVVMPVLRRFYVAVAKHRACVGGTCRVPARRPG